MSEDDWKVTLREKFVKSARESCRHFNGVQNVKCKLGIPYENDSKLTMPCIPKFINGREIWACDKFEIMSVEDAEKEADERIVRVERGAVARKAAHDHARAKGLGKGHGGYGSLPCPSCSGGTLQYSVASYNGHMHGRCTTKGCVSWME